MTHDKTTLQRTGLRFPLFFIPKKSQAVFRVGQGGCQYSARQLGTTGWYDKKDEVEDRVRQAKIGYLYGPNFSLGAHLFFRLVEEAAAVINPFQDYDISAYEIHHKRKKDSPSGTALKIADIILKSNTRKTNLVVDRLDRSIEEKELHFASVRGGENPGVHTVVLDSEADTIELVHRVRNRKGFALGAVLAAEWLVGKQGFFTVEHFIDEILGA